MWISSSVVGLLAVGFAFGQQPASVPPAYNKGDTITLQEPGKPEQKVKVLKTTRGPDGKMTYEVQDMQSGDKATISDSPPAMPAAAAPAPKKGLFRFMSSKSSRESRKMNVVPNSQGEQSIGKQKMDGDHMVPVSAPVRPASGTSPKQKESRKEANAGMAPMSDWQESWGKAADHSCRPGVAHAEFRGDVTPVQTAGGSPTLQCASASMIAKPMTPILRTMFTAPRYPTEVATQMTPSHAYPWAGSPYWYGPRIPSAVTGGTPMTR
jgi:hypothetical protein